MHQAAARCSGDDRQKIYTARRRAAESCIQARRYFPPEHVSAEPIHANDKINETGAQSDVRDIA